MKSPEDKAVTDSGVQSRSIDASNFEAPKLGDDDALVTNSEVASANSRRRGTSRNQHSQVKRRWWHSQFNLMLAVFGLLALAAILFVLLLPSPEVSQPNYVSIESKSLIPDSQAPWTQSQQVEARSESQAILSNLLASKKSLEQKEVLVWAPKRYQQALDLAAQGDELYKETNFAGAMQAYQNAVDQMDGLYDLLPAIIKTRLEEGDVAINEGKSELAKQYFAQVLALDEGNLRASEGLGRATKLDQVLQLLLTAAEREKDYLESSKLESLLAAKKDLQEAFAIDQKFSAVSEGIKRVDSEIVDKRFKLAMSDAYKALFSNRYSSARKAFSTALRIKPGDPTAKAALQQSLASDKTASLASLLKDAGAFEAQELWTSALSNYETVLKRDVNQVSAKLGQIRSRARSQLDDQIIRVLSDTLGFGRTAQRNEAVKILADAKNIKRRGPILKQQITKLESALADSDIKLKVSLVSDSLTAVSLQKVGSKPIELGKFKNRKMVLKPGRYIAIGVRLGFQDVRKEIELHPSDKSINSIVVKCEQAITPSAPTVQKKG